MLTTEVSHFKNRQKFLWLLFIRCKTIVIDALFSETAIDTSITQKEIWAKAF